MDFSNLFKKNPERKRKLLQKKTKKITKTKTNYNNELTAKITLLKPNKKNNPIIPPAMKIFQKKT